MEKKILMIGTPNSGKSAIFSRMTGKFAKHRNGKIADVTLRG